MIFLDSGAMIALYHEADPFREAAIDGFARLEQSDETVATTPLCIAETLSVLGQMTDHASTARIALEILDWDMEVIRTTLAEEKRAARLMESYSAKRVGYVDCISFVVMDARATRTAFTFDAEHFVKVRKLKTWVPIPRTRR